MLTPVVSLYLRQRKAKQEKLLTVKKCITFDRSRSGISEILKIPSSHHLQDRFGICTQPHLYRFKTVNLSE